MEQGKRNTEQEPSQKTPSKKTNNPQQDNNMAGDPAQEGIASKTGKTSNNQINNHQGVPDMRPEERSNILDELKNILVDFARWEEIYERRGDVFDK